MNIRDCAGCKYFVKHHGNKNKLKKADIAYCKKCIHHGNFDQQILCEYMYHTGRRRGCRAGAGCEKREVTKNEKTANAG